MIKKLSITSVIIAALAISLGAQAPPAPRIEWDFIAETIATVNTYSQVVTLDNVVVTTPRVCAQNGANVTCYVAIPALAAGNHNILVVAGRNGIFSQGGASINPATGPKPASDFRYIINVTIQVP